MDEDFLAVELVGDRFASVRAEEIAHLDGLGNVLTLQSTPQSLVNDLKVVVLMLHRLGRPVVKAKDLIGALHHGIQRIADHDHRCIRARRFDLLCDQYHAVTFYAPTLQIVDAGTLTDAGIQSLLLNFYPVPDNTAQGSVALQKYQKLYVKSISDGATTQMVTVDPVEHIWLGNIW